MARKHLSQLSLPEAGIRSAAFTAHSFPAHGSSGSFRLPSLGSVFLLMAHQVQQTQVFLVVAATLTAPDVVMPVQFLTVHQRRSTGRAGSVLAYRQGPLVGRQH